MHARIPLGTSALVALVLAAPLSAAEPVPASTAAQVLFEEARELMKRAEYDQACPKLAESQRLDPSSGTLLNLALCEEGLGKVASAWVHARELVDVLPPTDVRRPFALHEVAALAARLPRVSVILPAHGAPDLRVSLDGVALEREALGSPVPVDPGLHHLAVAAPGHVDRLAELTVSEGQVVAWIAEPGPVVLASALPAPQPPRIPESSRIARSGWPGWTFLGVGAGGVVAGVILGVLSLERRSTVLADCPGKQCSDASGLDAADQGQALFVASMASLGIGVSGLGLGAYLTLRPDPGVAGGRGGVSTMAPTRVLAGYAFSF